MSDEELVRIYAEGFQTSHEAGVRAVYDAAVAQAAQAFLAEPPTLPVLTEQVV